MKLTTMAEMWENSDTKFVKRKGEEFQIVCRKVETIPWNVELTKREIKKINL